jgi:hypothetical protein
VKANEFTKCVTCGRGMAASGVHFYRVTVQQHILNTRAIQRAAGLEMMVGPLASVLGPDEDLAAKVAENTVLICADCSLKETCVPMLLEGA